VKSPEDSLSFDSHPESHMSVLWSPDSLHVDRIPSLIYHGLHGLRITSVVRGDYGGCSSYRIEPGVLHTLLRGYSSRSHNLDKASLEVRVLLGGLVEFGGELNLAQAGLSPLLVNPV